MPYKFATDKKKIPRELDKRVKLTDSEREEIKFLYGKVSQRQLAKKYNVSRRLIIFIGCPEKLERARELYKERRKDKRYYNTELHKKYMKTHRRRKQLIKEKLI
jgi:IS30 family transposase